MCSESTGERRRRDPARRHGKALPNCPGTGTARDRAVLAAPPTPVLNRPHFERVGEFSLTPTCGTGLGGTAARKDIPCPADTVPTTGSHRPHPVRAGRAPSRPRALHRSAARDAIFVDVSAGRDGGGRSAPPPWVSCRLRCQPRSERVSVPRRRAGSGRGVRCWRFSSPRSSAGAAGLSGGGGAKRTCARGCRGEEGREGLAPRGGLGEEGAAGEPLGLPVAACRSQLALNPRGNVVAPGSQGPRGRRESSPGCLDARVAVAKGSVCAGEGAWSAAAAPGPWVKLGVCWEEG